MVFYINKCYIFVLRKQLSFLKLKTIKMKTLVKLVNGTEVSRKAGYANNENAKNAGNSWKRDCTVHGIERQTRSFFVIDTENESLPVEIAAIKEVIENNGGIMSYTSDQRRSRPTGCPMRVMSIKEIELLSNEEYYIAFSIGLIGNNGHVGKIIANCHIHQGAFAN